MLVKLRSDVYVRILSVELMVTPGRDRYCQKVTRRQGNGLGHQQARTVCWRREELRGDGMTQKEDNHENKVTIFLYRT